MKGRIVAVLFIVVFVLLIAVVFSLLNDSSSTEDISSFRIQSQQTDGGIVSQIETPPVTQAPQTTWLPNPTTEPVYVPAVTPAPTPVPTPTPAPTPVPVPVNTVIGSGSFESNNAARGKYLDIVANWTATTVSEYQAEVEVVVNTKSWQLESGSFESVHISLGDQYATCTSNPINYQTAALGINELARHTFTVELPNGASNTYPLQVEWEFGGVYMMEPFPVLECGGTVNLSR